MTNQQHPITPPLALIDQWWDEAKQNAKYDEPIGPLVATQAARWGANQELEACLGHLIRCGFSDADILRLRTTRRPQSLSLKEQALHALDAEASHLSAAAAATIRRALESE